MGPAKKMNVKPMEYHRVHLQVPQQVQGPFGSTLASFREFKYLILVMAYVGLWL